MKLQWQTYKHRSGEIASIEASVVVRSFPGLDDEHRVVIHPGQDGRAMAYITLRDGQLSAQTRWANKVFSSVRSAQAWGREQLKKVTR